MRVARLALALCLAACTVPEPGPAIDVSGVAAEADRLRSLEALARECPPGNRACAPAGKPELPRARGPEPVGAAGFELSMIEKSAMERCTSHGRTWKSESRDLVSCSGSVGEDLPFRVTLQLCDGNVCRILLSERLTNVARAVDVWTAAADDLTHKLGPPSERVLEVPGSCSLPSSLGTCLDEGRAQAAASWAWVSGAGVTVELVAPSPRHVFLFVVYSAPAVGRLVRARGL